MIKTCPNCNQVYTISNNSGDYVHDCNSGNDTLDNDDIVVLSIISEEFGESVNTGQLQSDIYNAGLANKASPKANVNKVHIIDYDGDRKVALERERKHFEFVK